MAYSNNNITHATSCSTKEVDNAKLLPPNLISDLLSTLPTESHDRFITLCEKWNNMTMDPIECIDKAAAPPPPSQLHHKEGNAEMAEVSHFSAEKTGCGKNLPLEIIAEIVCRLPMDPLLHFKNVCKTWYSLTKVPFFINLQLNRATCQPQRLILAPILDSNSPCSLYLLDRGKNKRKSRKIPVESMPSGSLDIVGSCNGLLCIQPDSKDENEENDTIFVCNPITRECIKLPDSEYKLDVRTRGIGFGFDPMSQKYKVVRVQEVRTKVHDYEYSFQPRGEIISVGEKTGWREVENPCSTLYESNLERPFHYYITPLYQWEEYC